MAASAADVAKWMLEEFNKKKLLYQDDAADRIAKLFGEEFTYMNDNGGTAIAKPVLAAFNKLSGKDVVWVRSELYWRPREKGDEPGRMQSY